MDISGVYLTKDFEMKHEINLETGILVSIIAFGGLVCNFVLIHS